MERTSEGRTRRHHLNAAKPENHTAPRPSRGVTMELKAFRGAFQDHFRMPNAVHAPMRVCMMRKYSIENPTSRTQVSLAMSRIVKQKGDGD